MSFYNRDKNPFPFYKLEGEIWTNVKPLWFKNQNISCCYNHKIGIGLNYFQLPIPNGILTADDVTGIDLRNSNTNVVIAGTTITKKIYVGSNGEKYLEIRLDADAPLIGEQYYLAVSTTEGNYYSEVFCIDTVKPNDITIEWASSLGIVSNMVYPNAYKHSINVDAVIVKAEPEIEEETEEDGLGNEFATLKKLKQGYRLSFVAPLFLAEALSALPLHDKVNFINNRLGESAVDLNKVNRYVQVKSTPEEDGVTAFVEIDYVDEIITSTSCKSVILEIGELFAELLWADTDSKEDRSFEFNNNFLAAFNISYEVTDESIVVERLISYDLGENWQVTGFGVDDGNELIDADYAFFINETGVTWHALRLNYNGQQVFFSNILKLTLT